METKCKKCDGGSVVRIGKRPIEASFGSFPQYSVNRYQCLNLMLEIKILLCLKCVVDNYSVILVGCDRIKI